MVQKSQTTTWDVYIKPCKKRDKLPSSTAWPDFWTINSNIIICCCLPSWGIFSNSQRAEVVFIAQLMICFCVWAYLKVWNSMLKELLSVSIDVVEQFGVCDLLSYAMGRECPIFQVYWGYIMYQYRPDIDQVLLSNTLNIYLYWLLCLEDDNDDRNTGLKFSDIEVKRHTFSSLSGKEP